MIDTPVSVSSRLGDFVNHAVKELQRRHNFGVMKALTSVMVTAASTRVLAATPSDFKSFRKKPYWVGEDRGNIERMGTFEDIVDIPPEYTTTSTGPPAYLRRTEPTDESNSTNLEVWPLSDSLSDYSDGEYRIYLPYWKYLAELTDDSDSNWFTDNHERFIEAWAVYQGFMAAWDEGQASGWHLDAEKEYRSIIKDAKFAEISAMDTLVPLWKGGRSTRLSK